MSPDCDRIAVAFGAMLKTLNPDNVRVEAVMCDMLAILADRDEALADAFEARINEVRNEGP